jgi:hypothetical protein
MAKDKKSFLIYCDIIHTVEKLSDKQAGILFKHVLNYVNDKNPEPPDLITEIAFEPIKQSLKRDLKKYESIVEKNRENAMKRWNKNNATASDRIRTDPKNADSDSDSDSDSVNVNNNKINIDKINFVDLLDFFNHTFKKQSRVINDKIKRKYQARLKEGYTKEDIAKAMRSCSVDKFHKESNFKYCTLEFFSRSETIDKHAFNSQTKNNYIATK